MRWGCFFGLDKRGGRASETHRVMIDDRIGKAGMGAD